MFITTTIIAAVLLMSDIADTLQTATVLADRDIAVSRTDTLEVRQSQTITELLLRSPGASVSDNGGYAGLKTLSIRGMGSPHTAIYIDGVKVGNVQSGQGDLGVPGLENYSCAIIDYARNSLTLTTARHVFKDGHRLGGKAGVSAGSFGTWLPHARVDWKISEKLTLSANADVVLSKGDFPYGDGQRRENNDIREVRGGLDAFGTVRDGDWHAKAWYHGSERGTPGSVSWLSEDRQKDRNVFVQGMLNKQFTSLYHLKASAKIAYDDIFYTSSWGDSRYIQKEAQLSSSHRFNVGKYLTLDATADIYWDGLNSSNCNQQRLGTAEAVSASVGIGKFRADIAIRHDGVFDREQKGIHFISPTIDLKFNAFKNLDIVAFAGRACRTPTFNELYYVGYGNPELKAEDAWMTDLGIDWRKNLGAWKMKAKIDGYYNRLHDKITSVPSEDDPGIWLPCNIGQVRSAGADIMAGTAYSRGFWEFSFSAKYGYQDAVDITPGSSSNGERLAYTAKHGLTIDATASFKGWTAAANWNLRAGRRDSYGEMPDWNTLDLFLKKGLNLGKAGRTSLKLALKNITNNRYELSSGYPMPGISIIGGIEYEFAE